MSNSAPVAPTKRFIVTSVTGLLIEPRYMHGGTTWQKPPTVWYVNDTVYNHRVVAAFTPKGGRTSRLCKLRAERRCDELNAWAATA